MYRTMQGVILLLVLGNVQAQGIYRWVDESGVTHFGDSPQAPQAKVIDVGVLNTVGSEGEGSGQQQQQPMIIMYSAEWCGVCKKAKAYFSKHNVNYSDYDVEKSPRGISFYSRLQQKSVPQFMINGRRVAGFTKSNFDNLLGIKDD